MILKTKKPSKRLITKSSAPQAQLPSFSDHIKELRSRLLWLAAAFMVLSALAYNYHDFLVDVVLQPLNHQKLVYLTPGGGFTFIFQVSLYAGLIATAPVVIYHLYGFLRPALPAKAQKSTVKVICFATLLLLAGVSFGYFVAIPAALSFLSNFAGADIVPNLTADSYLNFFLSYVAGLGVLFQLPLILLLWHWVNPFTPSGLLKSERFVIVFAFAVAALITPTPDIFNQAMIAVPLIAIYQIGVVAVLIAIKRKGSQGSVTSASTPLAIVPEKSVVEPAAPPSVVPTVPVQRKPTSRPRALDGFSVRSTTSLQGARRDNPPVPYISRQLTRPSRPTNSRPITSVDGISTIKT